MMANANRWPLDIGVGWSYSCGAMVARLARFLMIATLVATTGAHWALLQSVAWTTMLADNLCCGSVSDAVAHTFDGKHPCPICKAIAAGKKSEKKREFTHSLQKFECPPAQTADGFPTPARFELAPLADTLIEAPTLPPPAPPPRGISA
jgi:hypothetical protein